MNPRKTGQQTTDGLKAYLASVPEVTEADLEALRASARKLEGEPLFQADFLKRRFVEEMLAAMNEQGVSQMELAKKWGKTRQYVSKLLSEDRRVNFTIETLCEFARLLDRRVEIQVVRPAEAALVIRTVPKAETAPTIWKEGAVAGIGGRHR